MPQVGRRAMEPEWLAWMLSLADALHADGATAAAGSVCMGACNHRAVLQRGLTTYMWTLSLDTTTFMSVFTLVVGCRWGVG